jgi:hypothetical protein
MESLWRRVAQPLVKHGLYLFYYAKKHSHISGEANLSALVDEAKKHILSMSVDDEILKGLSAPPQDKLAEMGLTEEGMKASLQWPYLGRTNDGS